LTAGHVTEESEKSSLRPYLASLFVGIVPSRQMKEQTSVPVAMPEWLCIMITVTDEPR
jgi:hypothetical protein